MHLGDHDTARRLFDEAAAASREIGDGAGEVLAGYGYGLLAHVDGDWDQARRHYAIAVDGFIDLGTPVPEGVALAGLGRCDEADGDTAAAKPVPGSAGTGPPARRTECHRVRPRRARTPRCVGLVTGLPRPRGSSKRPASRNGSTGPHHRTNATTSSTSSRDLMQE